MKNLLIFGTVCITLTVAAILIGFWIGLDKCGTVL